MPQRHTVPPKTEKEQFLMGFTMPQLIWAGGGVALGFGGFMLVSKITGSMFASLLLGAPIGGVVVPFIFYKPKERSMTFAEYLRYKWRIKHRNNILPNKKTDHFEKGDNAKITSTDDIETKKDVRTIDIRLGGGN